MFTKTAGLAALALAAALAAADETCVAPPTRAGPGRDVSFGNYMCEDQIGNCATLCKHIFSVNTCYSDNDGVDNPFEDITYCFECVCADGSTPDLAEYMDTIPNDVCQRYLENCQYAYAQYGEVAPDGACTPCGTQYASPPDWYYQPTATSAAAVATTSSSSSTEATDSSTAWSSTSSTASTSTSASVATTTSSLELSSSSQTVTSQLPTTVHTSTTPSATHSSTEATSATSPAPVKSAGGATMEPAMAVFGMGLAAVMVL